MASAPRQTRPQGTKAVSAPIEVQFESIDAMMRSYADRRVFRGCSEARRKGARLEFAVVWHFDLVFRIVIDAEAGVVSIPRLLPDVPSRSPMAKSLRGFLSRFASLQVPPHRRIDPRRARLEMSVRANVVRLSVATLDGDFEYATRRLIHIVQEVFLVFLPDGPYFDYRVASLGLNPDSEGA